jgi:hypothetical protein
LATAISPLIRSFIGHLNQPRVGISMPSAHLVSTSRGFNVSGTDQDIPDDDDLWLVLRAPNNFWYPIARLKAVEGNWSVGAHELCFLLGSGVQDVQVWLVPDTVEGPLINSLSANTRIQLEAMPPGSTLEVHRTVRVPQGVHVHC